MSAKGSGELRLVCVEGIKLLRGFEVDDDKERVAGTADGWLALV